MLPETLVFAIAMLITGAILFLLIYFVIILSDLECDYLNAQQCCSKLNFWVVPKLSAHCFLAFVLLLNGSWILFIANAPMVVWLLYDLIKVPTGNLGIYDPAEIHNRGMVKRHLRDTMIGLGFYMIIFFVYLYCMIIAMLKGDPIRRHEEEDIITEF
ncbi:ER-derived vesicles protein ERV14 [Culex quinquefasciatus]|uniref:ER-derived vesicles protein ERV14 n=1 Tax=Culex quinquefasciatus TaxID=7176 RepID=B0W1J8_CULQU|nr:protein cornichon homolog 4 [Culex quinquefasciatus]EDS25796.1 ER-derived vesicles protein ERV14 [Culex quinquefasciatus]|eukprot:XP_001842582.1 ER-derived vesicles protein ERV14 [Culex quinquefasciatus]